MAHDFTQKDVSRFYQALTSVDESFVDMMVKAAIDSSADVHCDMWADREGGNDVPDVGVVRDMAKQYTTDLVADFMRSFDEKVTNVKFELRLRLRHHTLSSFE